MEPVNSTTQAPVQIRPAQKKPPTFNEEKFYPSGAIAFFIILVLLGLLFWFGIYFIMLNRI